jgi:hypothetical protein
MFDLLLCCSTVPNGEAILIQGFNRGFWITHDFHSTLMSLTEGLWNTFTQNLVTFGATRYGEYSDSLETSKCPVVYQDHISKFKL